MPEKAPNPVPEGMNAITTHLWFNKNCSEAIEFYKKAFGAELMEPPVHGFDEQSIMHAMMKVGDSQIMMADAFPQAWESGPEQNTTASLWVYSEDCDALYNRSVKAGCDVLMEVMDAFWGDRMGKVKDPFGHCWVLATREWILTPEEMKEKKYGWLKTLKVD